MACSRLHSLAIVAFMSLGHELFADPTGTAVVAHSPVLSLHPTGKLRSPPGFWDTNSLALFAALYPSILQLAQDAAYSTVAEYVEDMLEGYLPLLEAYDGLLPLRGSHAAARVSVEPGFAMLSGADLQSALESLDRALSNLYARTAAAAAPGAGVIQNTGTNASGLNVNYTPTSYSPASASLEDHLRAIHSRLAFLLAASGGAPNTNTLSSVGITGSAQVNEGAGAAYTLTAYYSDGSSSNVSTAADATWSFEGSIPAGTAFQTNVLVVGDLLVSTSITIRGQYTWNGFARGDTKTVLLVDTNEPALDRLAIVGPGSLNENQAAAYQCWAIWDNGHSNEVTQATVWDVEPATFTNSFWTSNVLRSVEVLRSTNVWITAQYASGIWLKGQTNPVSIVNTSNWLFIRTVYTGSHHLGTARIMMWDHKEMWHAPTYWALFEIMSLQGDVTFRRPRPSLPAGMTNTFWFLWVDAIADNALNGNPWHTARLPNYPGSPQWIEWQDPAAMADGCAGNVGINLNDYPGDLLLTFHLSETPPPGTARVNNPYYAQSGGANIYEFYYGTLTMQIGFSGRSFICEQDFWRGTLTTTNPITSGGTYEIRTGTGAPDGQGNYIFYNVLFDAP